MNGINASQQEQCLNSMNKAVEKLQAIGQTHHCVNALIERAKCCGYYAEYEQAILDLDEAMYIAERGPMPLFQADIHLHRARLFCHPPCASRVPAASGPDAGQDTIRRETRLPQVYPWQSPAQDLRRARRLIEKHGYWRRKQELEDAEACILPLPP